MASLGGASSPDKPRSPALVFYLSLTLILTLATGLALLFYAHSGHSLLEAELWSEPADRFGDFFHYHSLFAVFHTAAFFTAADRFAYPAPCAVVYAWLFRLGPYAHAAYNIMLAASALASAALLYRNLRRFLPAWRSVGLCAFLLATSYPWFRLWDRGNLELFVYIFVAGGVWAWLTGRRSLAAVLWGCAGAMKIYPLALLAVFLHRGRWRPLLVGLASCTAVLLASFWYVGPTLREAALGSLHGVTGFVSGYAGTARRSELNVDHSLLGALKELLSLHILHLGQDWPRLSLVYQAVIAIAAPLFFFLKVRRLPALNRLCLLLIAIVLLPPVSYDYTLIHVYLVFGIVLVAYLHAQQQHRPLPRARAWFTSFAVLFTSQTWIQLRGMRVNGLLKCAALLLLSGLLLSFALTMESETQDAAAARPANEGERDAHPGDEEHLAQRRVDSVGEGQHPRDEPRSALRLLDL